MAAPSRDSALTDEKTLEPEQASSTDTPKSQRSRRSSHEVLQEQDEEQNEIERTVSGILPPKDDPEKQAANVTETGVPDPNVVDWDENDPENPQNWTNKKKWGNMSIISGITFLTPLASSMVAPGVQLIMREFHSTDQTIGSFIVSIYVLGYAVG